MPKGVWPRHPGGDPVLFCKWCGEQLVRRVHPYGKLERYQDFRMRSYCSRMCNVNAIARRRREIRDEGRSRCG